MIKRKKRDKDKNVETRLHLRIYVHLQLLHDATAHCTRSFVRHITKRLNIRTHEIYFSDTKDLGEFRTGSPERGRQMQVG